jgi:hypothetical protein
LKSQLARLRLAALMAITVCSSSTALALDPSLYHAVTLTWTAPTENEDGTALTDLQGYYIYAGDSPYFMIPVYFAVPHYSHVELSYWDTVTHYFGISAVNVDGVESEMTGPLSWTPGSPR